MNHRDQEGRRDYSSGRGRDPQQTQRGSRYGRSDYEDHPEYSARVQRQGRDQGYQFGRDEYYGSRQFSERGPGSSEQNPNWEYEGGPEHLGATAYEEGRHEAWNLRSQREQGAYGTGTGSYYNDQQRYGTQGAYNVTPGQSGFRSGSSRAQSGRGLSSSNRGSEYGDASRHVYGGESSGYGGRSSLYGNEYLDDDDLSGRSWGGSRYAGESGSRSASYSSSMSPGYRGVGPKNYRRSDERLTEEINERLTDDDYLDASEITVRVADGKVTLEGTVDQRWMKHLAEDIADACSGVKEVDNRITVAPGSAALNRSTGSATRTSAGPSTTTGSSGGSTGAMPH